MAPPCTGTPAARFAGEPLGSHRPLVGHRRHGA